MANLPTLMKINVICRMISDMKKECKLSEEHKRKIGLANKGIKRSFQTRKNMSFGQKGKKHSKKTKEKISKTMKYIKSLVKKPDSICKDCGKILSRKNATYCIKCYLLKHNKIGLLYKNKHAQ